MSAVPFDVEKELKGSGRPCIVCDKRASNACKNCRLPICSRECLEKSWKYGSPHRKHCSLIAKAEAERASALIALLTKYSDVVNAMSEEEDDDSTVGMAKHSDEDEREKRMKKLKKKLKRIKKEMATLERKRPHHHRHREQRSGVDMPPSAATGEGEPPRKITKYAGEESANFKVATEKADSAFAAFSDAVARAEPETATTATAPPTSLEIAEPVLLPSNVSLSAPVVADQISHATISMLPYDNVVATISLASIGMRDVGKFMREIVMPVLPSLKKLAPRDYDYQEIIRDIGYMGTIVLGAGEDTFSSANVSRAAIFLMKIGQFNLENATVEFELDGATVRGNSMFFAMLKYCAIDHGARAFRFSNLERGSILAHDTASFPGPLKEDQYEITVNKCMGSEKIFELFETIDHVDYIESHMADDFTSTEEVKMLLASLTRCHVRVVDIAPNPACNVQFFASLIDDFAFWNDRLRKVKLVADDNSSFTADAYSTMKPLEPIAVTNLIINRPNKGGRWPSNLFCEMTLRFFIAKKYLIATNLSEIGNILSDLKLPPDVENFCMIENYRVAFDEKLGESMGYFGASDAILKKLETVGVPKLRVLGIPTIRDAESWRRIAALAPGLVTLWTEYACDPPSGFKMPETVEDFSASIVASLPGVVSAFGPRMMDFAVDDIERENIEAYRSMVGTLPGLRHLTIHASVDLLSHAYLDRPSSKNDYILEQAHKLISLQRAFPRISTLVLEYPNVNDLNLKRNLVPHLDDAVKICAEANAIDAVDRAGSISFSDIPSTLTTSCLIPLILCKPGGTVTLTAHPDVYNLNHRENGSEIIRHIAKVVADPKLENPRIFTCRAHTIVFEHWELRYNNECMSMINLIDALSLLDLRSVEIVEFTIFDLQNITRLAIVPIIILALRPVDVGRISFVVNVGSRVYIFNMEPIRRAIVEMGAVPELLAFVAKRAFAQLPFELADAGWEKTLEREAKAQVLKMRKKAMLAARRAPKSAPPSATKP